MQDWRIAVLVLIIVVFVVIAGLLLFLLYRFGHWRQFVHGKKKTSLRYIDNVEETTVRNTTVNTIEGATDVYQQLFLHDPRLRRRPHLLHFLDFQGELLSLDFKKNKKALQHVDNEPSMQRYLFDTYHPTIEEGNHVVTVAAEMLGLSYVNEQQTLVVLDLNRMLLRDSEFGARLMHTAERPLLLSRLVPDGVDGTVYTTLSRFSRSVVAPPPGSTGDVSGNAHLASAPPQRALQSESMQQRQLIEVDVAQMRGNPMQAAVAPPQPPALVHSVPASQRAASPAAFAYPPDTPGMAPPPIIHPANTHHITTRTPIFITAATYTVLHVTGARTVLDAANTAAIESARQGWDRRQALGVVLVSGPLTGYQCVIDPVTDNGNLFPPRGGTLTAAEPVICERADALQYTVERVSSTNWLPVERAFHLPAGRWCVRARSTLFRDDSSKSTAKVFTVNVM